MSRPVLLMGNWKMHNTGADVGPFFDKLVEEAGGKEAFRSDRLRAAFAVPYTLLSTALTRAKDLGISIAAQNVHELESGAYTGEISIPMLKDLGIQATLVGHSERRQYYNETDASVLAKTKACLQAGFHTVVCIGETLEQRESQKTEQVIQQQLKGLLTELKHDSHITIAYEPVWAIGTGKTASPEQAQEIHAFIRGLIREHWGEDAATSTLLLYGGSAKPGNIAELLKQPDVDGGLVGGASLKPEDFGGMIRTALK